MLPDARESQQQELGAQVSVPSPHLPTSPYTAWLQNTPTDSASLDSTVCVPASDASPQLQTNSVSPAHYSSCRLTQGSVYLNTVTDMHTFAYAHQNTKTCPLFIAAIYSF